MREENIFEDLPSAQEIAHLKEGKKTKTKRKFRRGFRIIKKNSNSGEEIFPPEHFSSGLFLFVFHFETVFFPLLSLPKFLLSAYVLLIRSSAITNDFFFKGFVFLALSLSLRIHSHTLMLNARLFKFILLLQF